MNEYNAHPEDDTQHPHPDDQHVAGSRWSDRDETAAEEPLEGRVEPADDEPMVEHVEEHPIGEEHVGQHAAPEPSWSEGPGEATASPFAAEAVHEDDAVRDDKDPIAMGAAADEEPLDHTAEPSPAAPMATDTLADAPVADGPVTDEPALDDTPVGEPALGDTAADTIVAAPPAGDPGVGDTAADTAVADESSPPVVADTPATGSRPTTGDALTVDRLVTPSDAERFTSEWHDVKADFVDDPSSSLRRASDLSTQVLEELTASLARIRQDLDDRWHDGDDSDTERLRIALRGYGSLIERILST